MAGFWFLVVIALVFAVIWTNLSKRPGPRAKIGPDGTNVRNPETFVVHHEGKGQSLDIANTALKERTEELSRDLPGDTHKIKTPVPGRDFVKMDAPPSDVSQYGTEKIAPGAVPGMPGAEPKAKVLMEGPQGSRPETPEEPGSPYAKGRRVTDIHRDVELAEEVLPAAFGRRQMDRDLAASPSTTGMEPGYGLGRTRPGETDGEGGAANRRPAPNNDDGYAGDIPRRTAPAGQGRTTGARTGRRGPEDDEPPDFPVEQPEVQDDLTDLPHGGIPAARLIAFRPDFEVGEEIVAFEPEKGDWSLLQEDLPLPAAYGEESVTAIVRNPRSLYVYWESSGEGERRLREMLGDAAYAATIPCLRIFDVGADGSRTIDLTGTDDHWFINDLEPGHRYVVAHERRTEDDRYYLLALSQPVKTPGESAGADGLLYERLAEANRGPSSPWR